MIEGIEHLHPELNRSALPDVEVLTDSHVPVIDAGTGYGASRGVSERSGCRNGEGTAVEPVTGCARIFILHRSDNIRPNGKGQNVACVADALNDTQAERIARLH